MATIVKSFDTFFNTARTFSSIKLSLTGIGSTVTPISIGIACALTMSRKIIYEIGVQKYINYKKHYSKDQQTVKSFDKIYKKSSQDNLIDKIEYEPQGKIFTKYLNETKD